jgi:enoyl-CoA hydratase/carnithine racemase
VTSKVPIAGFDDLLVARDGKVLVVTLHRPDRLNAWTAALESHFLHTLEQAERDRSICAIVVTGAGRGFCVGADLSGSVDDMLREGPPLPPRETHTFPPTMATPVIAAINGACAGVGLAVALHADIRFIADDAKLTTAFAKRGLVAEHGLAWLLPRLVGRGRAMDLLISARVFSGADAHRYGLAEFCLPAADVVSAAVEYAHELAANSSPTSIAWIKAQLLEADAPSVLSALHMSDDLTRRSYRWPDLREGIQSWQADRAAEFPHTRTQDLPHW